MCDVRSSNKKKEEKKRVHVSFIFELQWKKMYLWFTRFPECPEPRNFPKIQEMKIMEETDQNAKLKKKV